MQSQLPFTGSITDLLVHALGGKPAEFPLDAYLNRFEVLFSFS
jgi:hypothetical protein